MGSNLSVNSIVRPENVCILSIEYVKHFKKRPQEIHLRGGTPDQSFLNLILEELPSHPSVLRTTLHLNGKLAHL